MREHKATHTTAGIIPATPVTSVPPTTRPAEAASSEAAMTPPTGIVTDEQRDAREGEEDQYQLENYGERRRIRYNANPLQDAESSWRWLRQTRCCTISTMPVQRERQV